MKVLIAVILAFSGLASSASVPGRRLELPSYFQTCSRDQPDVNECILNSLRNLLPNLVQGVPELELPPIDPYFGEDNLLQYANGHIEAKAIIKDYVCYGMANLQFLGVRTNFDDLNKFRIEIDVYIPKAKIEGKYKLQGRFLTSEFGGNGENVVNMSNITTTWVFTGSQEIADGVRYMRIKKFDMAPEVGNMQVYASNLFNGNEALSKSVVKLFNQYWRIVYKELLPFARKWWDKPVRDVANKVFLRVPFDEIFPESS